MRLYFKYQMQLYNCTVSNRVVFYHMRLSLSNAVVLFQIKCGCILKCGCIVSNAILLYQIQLYAITQRGISRACGHILWLCVSCGHAF